MQKSTEEFDSGGQGPIQALLQVNLTLAGMMVCFGFTISTALNGYSRTNAMHRWKFHGDASRWVMEDVKLVAIAFLDIKNIQPCLQLI